MVIQEYFTYANAAEILFDPTPSYGGIWYFKSNILKLNSKVEDGKNLWQEFYNKNYIEAIKKYFKTDYVLNMPINLVSMPNADNIGRTLRFDRTSFFLGIINYLNHNIDNYDLSDEDKEKRIYELASYFNKSNEEINTYLIENGIQKYFSLELGMISNYEYYTGIIFAGYTFGSGEAVVKGGRYDKLLTYFGKEAASIGFTIVVDQLMAALTRQKIDIPLSNNGMMVVYTLENQAAAIQMAKALRMDGTPVELLLFDATKTKDDYQAYAKRNRITSVTFLED